MAKVKTIKQYRTEQIGNTTIEIPIADEESKVIMEVNFNQYLDVLADILVRYAANFKKGQIWETPVSAIHRSFKLNIVCCLYDLCQYI